MAATITRCIIIYLWNTWVILHTHVHMYKVFEYSKPLLPLLLDEGVPCSLRNFIRKQFGKAFFFSIRRTDYMQIGQLIIQNRMCCGCCRIIRWTTSSYFSPLLDEDDKGRNSVCCCGSLFFGPVLLSCCPIGPRRKKRRIGTTTEEWRRPTMESCALHNVKEGEKMYHNGNGWQVGCPRQLNRHADRKETQRQVHHKLPVQQ